VKRIEPAPNTEMPVHRPLPTTTDIPVETIDAALVRCISTALHQTQGKIYGDRGAAALLGLKPSTLQSKMRKLGIERAPFTD
jgi:transcriptional regulator with GAF, ATPase, and Fis domain